MYTLILPGRSHAISDEMGVKIIDALAGERAIETIGVEMNGVGSGEWEVIVNIRQVIALVKHPMAATSPELNPGLRLVPT